MKKGFTLIELLVVVLIIGVLSAVALPQYQKAVLKSRTAEAWINLKNLKMAAEAYCLENPRDSVYFRQDRGSSAPSWSSYGALSISISRSKDFTYEVPYVSCSLINNGLAGGAKALYEGSPWFVLGLNYNGYRSCEGSNCGDLGFSTSKWVSGAYYCASGGGTCYYID